MRFLRLLLLLFLLLLAIFSTNVISISAEDCSDYEFIFARGSGQSLGDADYAAYKDSIASEINSSVSFYELGTANNGYPAIGIDFNTALGAYVSAGKSYKYGESIELGVTELLSRIKNESKRCKNKKFILTGYSQGAQVVDEAIRYINSDRIVYVANFGDPKLYLPEGKTRVACKNAGLSPYRVYVPDCNVEEGVLSAIKPYQPPGFDNKLGVWCNDKDIVCGSSLNILNPLGAHTSYTSNENAYQKLAQILKEKISVVPSINETTIAKYSDAPPRDIALVLNDGQIISDSLKDKLVELSAHGTRIAIYSSFENIDYIKKFEEEISFTTDNLASKIDKLNFKLKGLIRSNLIENYDNSYWIIKYLSEHADWQDGHERNIYLLTANASGSTHGADGTTVKDAYEVAKNNDVKVSFLGTLSNATESHAYIIEETGGKYINDLSTIVLSKEKVETIPTYYSKTFDLRDSDNTLVIINGCLYGITTEKSITITGLDNSRENEITFVKYDSNGNHQNKKTYLYTIPEEKIKAPDTGGA